MNAAHALDLVVLVPGADEAAGVDTLLSRRTESLGIRPPRYELLRHPNRDPGCFHTSPAVLRPYTRRAAHALVIFDHEGSGQEATEAGRVESDLRRRLALSGWEDRAEAIALRPEFEIWVWTESPVLDRVLGWGERSPAIRGWLRDRGLWPEGQAKPSRPKECFQKVLRQLARRSTSAVFAELAAQVGLAGCTDPSFLRFREVLRAWLPPERGKGS